MIKVSPNARNQSSNLLIGRKPKLKLRLDYQNFTQRRPRQYQTSIIKNRQALAKKNPTLSSSICPRWESLNPGPDRLIPEDVFSDPPAAALRRPCYAEAFPDGHHSDESLEVSS
ncbi:hypothetical protein LINGRAHAP2_LOCUS22632 [Linum grandiflorum]